MILTGIILAVVFLAYANGANDNFKGVATLFGSGTARYRTALVWATVTTLCGSLLALALAEKLVGTFSGKGLVPAAVASEPRFLLAVSLAAAATVLMATGVSMPVSTTHALTGGLIGAGLLAAGGDVALSSLGRSVLVPLLFSPVVSIVLAVIFYPVLSRARRALGVTANTCVCIGGATEEARILPDGTMALARTGAVVTVADVSVCRTHYEGTMAGVRAGPVLDGLHFLSAGAVGFARGLNDTPKIVALVLAAKTLDPQGALVMVAAAIAVGGVVSARRVAETMSQKITRLNPGQGLTANLTTAALVTAASMWGLPVSTTHVSVGSLFGIGLVSGMARRKTVLSILAAWVTTLPVAATIGLAAYALLPAQ